MGDEMKRFIGPLAGAAGITIFAALVILVTRMTTDMAPETNGVLTLVQLVLSLVSIACSLTGSYLRKKHGA